MALPARSIVRRRPICRRSSSAVCRPGHRRRVWRCDGSAEAAALDRPSHTAVSSDWTTFDQNPLRTGVDASGNSFSPATPAWTSPTFDGQLYGQPLVFAGRVFAATENDTVYALAADTGQVLWSNHLATPWTPATVPGCAATSHPTVGITSTPVIDPARSEIFVVADRGGRLVDRRPPPDRARPLHRRRPARRSHRPGPFTDPAAQLQRASLALDDGNVIAGFGGNAGDCGTYHGLVVSAPEDGSTPPVFYVVANQPVTARARSGWAEPPRPSTPRATCGWRPATAPSIVRRYLRQQRRRAQAEPDACSCSTPSPRTLWYQDNGSMPTSVRPPRRCSRTAWCSRWASRRPPTSSSQSEPWPCRRPGGPSTNGFCCGDPDGGIGRPQRHPVRPVQQRHPRRHGHHRVPRSPSWTTSTRRPQLAHRRRGAGVVDRRRDPLRPQPGHRERSPRASPSAASRPRFPSPSAADGLVLAPLGSNGSRSTPLTDRPASPGRPPPPARVPATGWSASDGGIFAARGAPPSSAPPAA